MAKTTPSLLAVLILLLLMGCGVNGLHPVSSMGNYYGKIPEGQAFSASGRTSSVLTAPEYAENSLHFAYRLSPKTDLLIGFSNKDYEFEVDTNSWIPERDVSSNGVEFGILRRIFLKRLGNLEVNYAGIAGFEKSRLAKAASGEMMMQWVARSQHIGFGNVYRVYACYPLQSEKVVNSIGDSNIDRAVVVEELENTYGLNVNPYILLNIERHFEISAGLSFGLARTQSGPNKTLSYVLGIGVSL